MCKVITRCVKPCVFLKGPARVPDNVTPFLQATKCTVFANSALFLYFNVFFFFSTTRKGGVNMTDKSANGARCSFALICIRLFELFLFLSAFILHLLFFWRVRSVISSATSASWNPLGAIVFWLSLGVHRFRRSQSRHLSLSDGLRVLEGMGLDVSTWLSH